MNTIISEMTKALAALEPTELKIEDESHLHVGHAHAKAGHYSLTITSTRFIGLNRLAIHRLVHDTLGNIMHNIHALRIRASAPGHTID